MSRAPPQNGDVFLLSPAPGYFYPQQGGFPVGSPGGNPLDGETVFHRTKEAAGM